MATKFTLPELPYALDALEPVISKDIMNLHYNKHHATYVNNLNKALEDYNTALQKQDLSAIASLLAAINFNGGGHINHSIFWTNLAPQAKGGGGAPTGLLAKAIDEVFGSFDSFVTTMTTKSVAIQGSGWGWLGLNKTTKKLEMVTCPNQDPLISKGLTPLLGIDVWEHAYYLQYKNVRPDYVKNIWNIVNWKNVEARFEAALSGQEHMSVK